MQVVPNSDQTKDSNLPPKEPPILNTAWVEDGKIKAFNTDSKEVTPEFSSSVLFKNFLNPLDNNNQPRQSLSEIIKQPEQGIKYSWLNFPKYKIQAPIQWATFADLYEQNGENIDFNTLKDSSGLETPIQKLLQKGIVHLGYTVQPGEIGNSYIVGHSSNFNYVKSDYNSIFKPIESATKDGDEFFVYDQRGRELKFCVFENLKIPEEDLKTAYKEFPGERVVTLQTSILGWRDGKYEATHRWLARGSLCNAPDQKQNIEQTSESKNENLSLKTVDQTPAISQSQKVETKTEPKLEELPNQLDQKQEVSQTPTFEPKSESSKPSKFTEKLRSNIRNK